MSYVSEQIACSLGGCTGVAWGNAMCKLHNERARRKGDPHDGMRSPVGRIWEMLTIRRRLGVDRSGHTVVQVRCDCGTTMVKSMIWFNDPHKPKHCGCIDGSDGRCAKAPAAAFGHRCKCKRCRSARSTMRRKVEKAKRLAAAAERRVLAKLPDELAIDNVVLGVMDPSVLTFKERRIAIERMLRTPGVTRTQIAQHFRVDRRQVERQAARAGLVVKRDPVSDAVLNEDIARRYAAGETQAEIAMSLGIAKSTVGERLKKTNTPLRPPGRRAGYRRPAVDRRAA